MGDNCSVYMQIKAAISQMAALLYLSMSSAILRLRTARVIGLTPCQEPRCFAWYSRRAFLLRLSNGTNCVTADHLLLFVLV